MTSTGRPLPPQPTFRVVDATHIEVKWDKPFSGVDIQYYTLTIINMEDDSKEVYTYPGSGDTSYPVKHYQSTKGHIQSKCNYLQFNLTATSAAGTSDTGSVIGSFPIGMCIIILSIIL